MILRLVSLVVGQSSGNVLWRSSPSTHSINSGLAASLRQISKTKALAESLKGLGKDDPISSIDWENLISLITVEFSDLQGCYAMRRSARSSAAYPMSHPDLPT